MPHLASFAAEVGGTGCAPRWARLTVVCVGDSGSEDVEVPRGRAGAQIRPVEPKVPGIRQAARAARVRGTGGAPRWTGQAEITDPVTILVAGGIASASGFRRVIVPVAGKTLIRARAVAI